MTFFKTAILATIAALAINDVTGVALNTIAACQKPENGGHKEHDSCAYVAGPSDTQSSAVSGSE
ncbi:hypothetical protein V8F06_012434 [Rhypophila decipiens]